MKSSFPITKPVGAAAALDTSGTNVTSSAYVQLLATTTSAASAMMLHNSGAQPLKLAIGGAGSEVDTGIVIPIAVTILVPCAVGNAKRLAVKSIGGTQSSGIVTVSFYA